MTAQIVKIKAKDQLRCPDCHTTVDAPCSCGVDYIYVPAREVAREAVARSPEKSNRALAAETGLSKDTIRAARPTGGKSPVEKRVGRDGKSRRLPEKKLSPGTAKKLRDGISRQIGQGQGLANYVVASSWRTRVTKPHPVLIEQARAAAAEWRKVAKVLGLDNSVPFEMSCRAGVYGNAVGSIAAAQKALAAAAKLKTKGHARDKLASDASSVAEAWEIVAHICALEAAE